jgi:ribonuclease HII
MMSILSRRSLGHFLSKSTILLPYHSIGRSLLQDFCNNVSLTDPLVKRKRKPIPINPETGLPYSKGTMKMRLLKRLKCTQKFEKLAWAAGAQFVAGVDEVGRGSLFGPVVAGAVILERDYRIKGLRDSKLLDQKTREKLAERIKQHAIAYAVAAVDVARIDQINIYWASLLAMREAVAQLAPAPDHLLIDAVRINWDCPQTKIIHGDALSISIAAASIIAKVHRDEMIRRWAPVYPEYDLASNKGYRSPKHIAALREHGPTPLHRLSFAPVWMCNVNQEEFVFEDDDAAISEELGMEHALAASGD